MSKKRSTKWVTVGLTEAFTATDVLTVLAARWRNAGCKIADLSPNCFSSNHLTWSDTNNRRWKGLIKTLFEPKIRWSHLVGKSSNHHGDECFYSYEINWPFLLSQFSNGQKIQHLLPHLKNQLNRNDYKLFPLILIWLLNNHEGWDHCSLCCLPCGSGSCPRRPGICKYLSGHLCSTIFDLDYSTFGLGNFVPLKPVLRYWGYAKQCLHISEFTRCIPVLSP